MADLVVVGVKVPPEVKERWLASAERGGVSLSVWVRGACEERVRAQEVPVASFSQKAKDPFGTPLPVKMRDEAPRVFRDSCSGSHVAGVVCSVCGGRMW